MNVRLLQMFAQKKPKLLFLWAKRDWLADVANAQVTLAKRASSEWVNYVINDNE